MKASYSPIPVCGKLHWRVKDLTGKRFGRLLVLGHAGVVPSGSKMFHAWSCKCDCGKETIALGNPLKRNETTSCGCLWKEVVQGNSFATGHGGSRTRLYRIWRCMKNRCMDSKNKNYSLYGGRGISVCERWMNFACFREDMGEPTTESHSIDRINGNGNYEPGNCRWATPKMQGQNKKGTIWITIKGKTKCLTEWCQHFGIARGTIHSRHSNGEVWGEAIFRPIDKRKSRSHSQRSAPAGYASAAAASLN